MLNDKNRNTGIGGRGKGIYNQKNEGNSKNGSEKFTVQ